MNSHDAHTASALAVAAKLIDAGCVSMRTDEPFRLPSGWASPAYIDCRRLISFPALRRELVASAVAQLERAGVTGGVQSVAGGEASGIALAAWIAEALALPLQYVRKRAVGHRQIEGVLRSGDHVLLVDDMMAAGHSKISFAAALRAAGATVQHVFVVFDYGTFDAADTLASLGLQTHALANWTDVLQVARQRGDFPPAALAELDAFLKAPSAWSKAHGGKSADTILEKALS